MADVAKAVKEGHELFLEYKKFHGQSPPNVDECSKLLRKLKIIFTRFPTFLNPEVMTATRAQEVILVRETLEHAVLLAAATKNMDDFEKHFEMLRVYYSDFNDEPKSERRLLILGLHLLRLLAVNMTRTFHMELERIKVVDQDSMYIKDVIQLERYIMEGSYHKMLQARIKAPSTHYGPIMEMLLETVRREVFKCATHSYETLSLEGARKLLMFDNNDELRSFVDEEVKKLGDAHHAWKLKGDTFTFSEVDDQKKKEHLPFQQLIKNQLHYTHELQRIA